MSKFERLREATSGMRVAIGQAPFNQQPIDDAGKIEDEGPPQDYAAYAFIVGYRNEKGEESQRRLSVKRIEGYGDACHIFAYCFESAMVKCFRIDRILHLADIATGELYDPFAHFEMMRLGGLIPTKDKCLHDLATILVFLAECDGEYHPLENDSIESALTAYLLRHGGSENDIERAMKYSRKLAPDNHDFVNALERIARHPDGCAVARQLERQVAAVISADEKITADEQMWAVEALEIIRQIAAGNANHH